MLLESCVLDGFVGSEATCDVQQQRVEDCNTPIETAGLKREPKDSSITELDHS